MIPKDKIEEAFEFHGMVTGLDHPSDKNSFEAGVEFAEKELENIVVEFIPYYLKRKVGYLNNESLEIRELLFKQFLKEKNNDTKE